MRISGFSLVKRYWQDKLSETNCSAERHEILVEIARIEELEVTAETMAEEAQKKMKEQGYYWPDNEVFVPHLPKFTRLPQELEDQLVKEVQFHYKYYESSYAAIQGIKNFFNLAENEAKTYFNTCFLGLRNQMEMDRNLEDGIVYFQYVGNGAQRKFCKEHLDKVYHIDEIMRLNNKQKLPVIYFCGGYNCMHSWRPIFDWQYAEFGVKAGDV